MDNGSQSGRVSSRPLSASHADTFSKNLKNPSSDTSFSDVLSKEMKSGGPRSSESMFSRRGNLVEQAIRSRDDQPSQATRSTFASWLLGL